MMAKAGGAVQLLFLLSPVKDLMQLSGFVPSGLREIVWTELYEIVTLRTS